MASIWDILGLEGPTTDSKAIKKAYARKLKTVRPDEDQAGFMALRDAFDRAKNYSKYSEEKSFLAISSDQVNVEVKLDRDPELPQKISVLDEPEEPSFVEPAEPSFVDVVIKRINAILDNPWAANDINSWHVLFEDPMLETIDARTDFDSIFRQTLLRKFGYYSDDASLNNRGRKRPLLSPATGEFIFRKMNWYEKEGIDPYVLREIEFLRQDLGVIDPYATPNENDLAQDLADYSEDSYVGAWWIAGLLVIAYLIFNFLFDLS